MVGIQIYISLINTFLKFLYKNKMAVRHLGDVYCLPCQIFFKNSGERCIFENNI
jgi:hypothetical protein